MTKHRSKYVLFIMADLQIKSIRIRNWMTVRESEITFPEKGLILVMGSNLAAEGKLQSVGSGKTGLGEALAMALIGVKGRFSEIGHFAEDKTARNMYVKLEASLLSKPLTVEMGYKCQELSQTGEGLKFSHGGKTPIQRGNPDQTRRELEKTIRVSPELANWTVFLDGDKLKFNRLSQEDSVNLLMSALAQPPWTEYFKLANGKLQAANRQVAASSQALEAARMRMTELKDDLAQAIFDHDEAHKDYQRQVDEQADRIAELKNQNGSDRAAVRAAEAAMAAIKKKLKVLEESRAEQNHKHEIERQNLRDTLAEIDDKRTGAIENRSTLAARHDQLSETLEKMQKVPKNCPTCSKPWDKAHSEEEIAKVEKQVVEAEAAWAKANDACAAYKKKRDDINSKILEIEKTMRNLGRTGDVETLGDDHARNEKMVRNLNAYIHERELKIAKLEKGIDGSFVNKKLAVVEERSRAVEKGQEAIETAASDLAMDQEAVKVVQYWHKAYGPTGIPNMILADAIPMMNRVAQRISSLMTGSTLEITYSTTKVLASGESRQKLITKVSNRIGSKRPEGSSKGEGGLTNLIIAENLSEIGQVSSRVGFRWYDEITNGQDPVVRRSVFAYLKDVAERMGILIFVVDHHAEAVSYADYVLVAEKSIEHGTRYFWR